MFLFMQLTLQWVLEVSCITIYSNQTYITNVSTLEVSTEGRQSCYWGRMCPTAVTLFSPPLHSCQCFGQTRTDGHKCSQLGTGLASSGVWRQPEHTGSSKARGSPHWSTSSSQMSQLSRWLQPAVLLSHWFHLHIERRPRQGRKQDSIRTHQEKKITPATHTARNCPVLHLLKASGRKKKLSRRA